MQPKRRNRKRAQTIGRWVEAAEAAKKLLEAPVPQGMVQSRLKDVAASVGLTHNTLSNYLLSHDFVSEVQRDRPDVAHILFRAAPIAVDAYRRWAKHDADGAFKHALEYGQGGIRIIDVIEAEKKARQRTYPERTSDAFGRLLRYREAVTAHLPKGARLSNMDLEMVARSSFEPVETLYRYDGAFARWLGLTQIGILGDDTLNATFDQWRREDERNVARYGAFPSSRSASYILWRGKADFPRSVARFVGVIEVRPLAIKENYRAIARQVALQATVASRFFDLVLVLLTDDEAMVEMTSFLEGQALPLTPRRANGPVDGSNNPVAGERIVDLAYPTLPGSEAPVMFTSPELCIPVLLAITRPHLPRGLIGYVMRTLRDEFDVNLDRYRF